MLTHDTWLRAMLATLRSVAVQRDPSAVEVIVRELLLDHVGERARCLFYDGDSHALWCSDEDVPSDALGLSHEAVRTLDAYVVEQTADDPRVVLSVDDPAAVCGRLLIQPVYTAAGEVHAVLTVGRSMAAPSFSERDQARVCDVAMRLAPLLDQLALQVELDTTEAKTDPGVPSLQGPYRPEAVAAYMTRSEWGEAMHVNSGWISVSYRILVSLLVAAVVYVTAVPVGDYARGPAVVRLGGRVEATARTGGSVVEVYVRPGDVVAAEQPLVRLHDAADAAELRRLSVELELKLRAMLSDPSDALAREAVARIRAEQERAELRARDHVVRAPVAGVVRDVRARTGQVVEAGDVLMSVGGEHSAPQLVALIPGDERPRLRRGMEFRLELDGYPDAPQSVKVDAVDEDVVSADEALRLLGPAVAQGLAVNGPVVIVRASLSQASFVSRQQSFQFHDGMRGEAEIEVRTTSIIEALIPALEEL
ncbi:MAG: efflux RND transporter periplasmic adaptor subunit [Nannocystales bacterium]